LFWLLGGGGSNISKLPPGSVENMQSLMAGKPQPFVLKGGRIAI